MTTDRVWGRPVEFDEFIAGETTRGALIVCCESAERAQGLIDDSLAKYWQTLPGVLFKVVKITGELREVTYPEAVAHARARPGVVVLMAPAQAISESEGAR